MLLKTNATEVDFINECNSTRNAMQSDLLTYGFEFAESRSEYGPIIEVVFASRNIAKVVEYYSHNSELHWKCITVNTAQKILDTVKSIQP